MYSADGSIQDNGHHSPTKLHLDLTDTLNLTVWAANIPSGEPDAAWDIFPRECLVPFASLLEKVVGLQGPMILSTYTTPAMIEQFITNTKSQDHTRIPTVW